MSAQREYWLECIQIAAEEVGLTLTKEQAEGLAESVQSGHENYGMAFYSPPASDRYAAIEGEWRAKYKALESEFEAYRRNAEKAVGTALRQHPDASISIGEHGEVFRNGGRTVQIQ